MEEENRKILEEKRELARKKIYSLAFEIFIIFGLPAGLVLGTGKFLDLSRGFQALLLVPAFVLSWIWFFHKFKKISAEIKELNQKIKENKSDELSPDQK